MIAVAVVTVASIALLAGVYNYVEQEKAKLDRSIAVSINGEVHRVAYNLEEEDPFSLWTKGFCDHEGNVACASLGGTSCNQFYPVHRCKAGDWLGCIAPALHWSSDGSFEHRSILQLH